MDDGRMVTNDVPEGSWEEIVFTYCPRIHLQGKKGKNRKGSGLQDPGICLKTAEWNHKKLLHAEQSVPVGLFEMYVRKISCWVNFIIIQSTGTANSVSPKCGITVQAYNPNTFK